MFNDSLPFGLEEHIYGLLADRHGEDVIAYLIDFDEIDAEVETAKSVIWASEVVDSYLNIEIRTSLQDGRVAISVVRLDEAACDSLNAFEWPAALEVDPSGEFDPYLVSIKGVFSDSITTKLIDTQTPKEALQGLTVGRAA